MSKKPAPKAAQPTKPAKQAAEPLSPLPKSLLQALPQAEPLLREIVAIEKRVLALRGDMEDARKRGTIALARAFVVLHRLVKRIDGALRPLVPEAFEAEGITSLPLAEGFRVGVLYPFRASLVSEGNGGNKDKAYQWLREHGLGDLIKPAVNSSSLSAAFRELVEDKNVDPPDDLFNAARIPNTSVTKT